MAVTQSAFSKPEIPEVEIPIEPIIEELDRTIDYTEDLWEITDQGFYDGEGEYYEEIPIEEPVETAPLSGASMEGDEELDPFEEYRQTIIESWGSKKDYTEKRLEVVKENLSDQMERFTELEAQIEEAQDKLSPIREEVSTLENVIRLINTQIQTTKDKVTSVEILIAEKQIEIKDLMLNLQRSEVELEIQKKIVLDYVKLLYAEEDQYFDLYSEGSSTIKLLLADASVSENLMGQEYLAVMEETGRQVFYDLERTHQELIEKQDTIEDEQRELEFLYDELLKDKRTLEETRLSKKELLEETKGEEEKYQELLDEAIQEQLATAIAVQNLQENLDLIESKLATLDEGLEMVEEAEVEGDLEDVEEAIEEVVRIPEDADENRQPFIWPVPANKITAYFHDPDYPAKWGEHNAIDIRAKQFTNIVAPANGYVFQTKDNGSGYSYIILAHKGNLVTVYGHVAEIIAQPGTIVQEGELIGLSGGTPGTKGAGLQTTGPHLHFEVHYKGEPVNPLDYLPLEEMPIEYVPDEYLKELQ
ncbi:peptidoglycan DD-metalloendopeptidase family protein [Patescibacteria group bacterium]|nr:peptidoglycan DD-metalloendopeptidase family protein [Patescibacteria group bacterium]MBU1683818.1 peptidoglycan DD-metalloendopeptidase family protein [Patescibacteria group bacterium]MBU1935215.1 peptidoglycan DD-metalloendopeptidase family protein [Patescibacteria group bacterium]